MLNLASPWWFTIVPALAAIWWLASIKNNKQKQNTALLHPQAELLIQLGQQTTPTRIPWLWLMGLSLLALALTRPQWITDTPQQGRNFLLALDVSSSMQAQDFEDNGQLITRLEMVRRVVDHFVQQRQGDRIGIIAFADDAFTLAPMTTDRALLQFHLNTLKTGMAGQRTALGDAITLGVKRLQSQDKQSRILILLTDGSNTAGEIHPLNALQLAQRHNVRIYSIGIGSNKQVMFTRGPTGASDFKVVPMDEELLTKLASQSGGQYYRAAAPEELNQIIDDIETLETVPLEQSTANTQEWYALPLILGLIFIALHTWRTQREVSPC